MASLSELLLRGAQESVAGIKPEGIAQPLAKGFELAQQVERTKQNRTALEQKKQSLIIQKLDRVGTAIQTGQKLKEPGAKSAYFRSFFPKVVKSLGLEEIISEDHVNAFQGSSEFRNKFLGIRSQVQEGKITAQEGVAQIQDFEGFTASDADTLFESREFAIEQKKKTERARILATGKAKEAEKKRATTGAVTLQKELAKEFANFQAAGGKSSLEANLKKLENAAKQLDSGKIKTGGISAFVPGEVSQEVLNPEVVAVRDDVRGAIQGTLRQTLGAQFTEREGQAIFNRAFNPRLSSKENARRIRQQINELRGTIDNKVQAFQKQGFDVKGVKPSKQPEVKSTEEKIRGIKSKRGVGLDPQRLKDQFPKFTPDQQESVLNEIVEKTKATREEILQFLQDGVQ